MMESKNKYQFIKYVKETKNSNKKNMYQIWQEKIP